MTSLVIRVPRAERATDEVVYVPVTAFTVLLTSLEARLEDPSVDSTDYLVGVASAADELRETLRRLGVTA